MQSKFNNDGPTHTDGWNFKFGIHEVDWEYTKHKANITEFIKYLDK